jgi:tetratricopeptide (TPR) repeat protein
MILAAVALVPVLVLAIDLQMVRNYYGTKRHITGWPAISKWLKRRRLALGALTVVYLAAGGVLLVLLYPNLARLPGLRHESSQYVESADRYLKEGKYNEAVIELRNAIKQNPDDSEALLLLARIQTRLVQYKEAVDSYRKVISLDPKQYDAHLELGRLAFTLKDSSLVLAEATEAVRLQPDKVEPRLLLAQIYQVIDKREPALEQCRAIAGKEFATPELRQQLVRLLIGLRAFGEALQAIETGLKAAPDEMPLKFLQAQALLELGRSAEAETVLRTTATANPVSPDPHIVLGDLLIRCGNYPGALKAYEEALKRNPDNDQVMNSVASLNSDHGYDLERSAALAARLHAKYPLDPSVADTLGWTLFLQGKLDQALPLLQQGVDGMPGNPMNRYHLGVALLKAGNPAAGKMELSEALRISGNFDGADKARALLGGKG